MTTFFTCLVLFILFIIWKMFIVVPMREACVKERLGKYQGVLEPGFHFLIPFFDNVAYRHETREQVLDIPSQSCITRDNIQVEVDGLVYLKVMDAQKASYGTDNYKLAAINLAQTTMRSEIGKLALDQSFSERDHLNEAIVREIDKAAEPWGIKVLRYEVRNITPSQHVIETLEQQMEAEREKRAEIISATAQKQATIAESEGVRQEAINISEGEKIERVNLAEGKAIEISVVAEAAARGVRMVAEALSKPGGDQALRMRIIDQFLDEFGQILESTRVSVVPTQLANLKGFFEGLTSVNTVLPSQKQEKKS